jgi:hypothetical protein
MLDQFLERREELIASHSSGIHRDNDTVDSIDEVLDWHCSAPRHTQDILAVFVPLMKWVALRK